MGLFIFFSLIDWYQQGFKITEQKKDGFGYFWNNWTQEIFPYIAHKKDRCRFLLLLLQLRLHFDLKQHNYLFYFDLFQFSCMIARMFLLTLTDGSSQVTKKVRNCLSHEMLTSNQEEFKNKNFISVYFYMGIVLSSMKLNKVRIAKHF